MKKFDRRAFMKALGVAGGSAQLSLAASAKDVAGRDVTDGQGGELAKQAVAAQDHDHSGDKLGVGEPVASITVNSVSLRDFDQPSNFLIFEEDGLWKSFQTSDQSVPYQDSDGVNVINSSLAASAKSTTSTRVKDTGRVRVLSQEGGTTLRSSSTIEHIHPHVMLTLEPGVTFEYTGSEEAVTAGSGNNHYFYFDVIDANGAKYCIRNTGVGTGSTVGNTLRGASDSLYFADAAAWDGAYAGQFLDIRELDCTAALTPYGFRATSGEHGAEGYWAEFGIVRGPTEAGVVVGDTSTQDSIGFFLFDLAVDGAINDANRLIVFNDKQNGAILEGFTPATGGDWDVEMADLSLDCPVIAPARSDDLRVKREILQTADLTNFDTFGNQELATNLSPASLDGYERIEQGSGSVVLDGTAGRVEHATGAELDSQAGLTRRLEYDFGDLSFDDTGVVQTCLIARDDTGQRAHLVWGDPDGQAVGWRIRDDVLEGFVSDGANVTALPLREDFYAGDAWNLTAFYNPPSDVVYYVDDLATQYVDLTGDDSSLLVTVGANDGSEALLHRGRDARYGGTISTNLPNGDTNAQKVMNVDITNTVTESKKLLWSNWKQYQYPDDSA